MSVPRHLGPLLLVVSTLATACNSDTTSPDKAPRQITALPRELTSTEQDVIAASNGFGFRLLHEINTAATDSNVFLSPLSATMALGMALDGAVSTTFDEMRSTLGLGTHGYDDINHGYQSLIALLRGLDSRVEFRIANAVFFDSAFGPEIEPTYVADATTYFDARTSALDFSAPSTVDTVNAWVSDRTNGRITELVDQLDPDLVMLLLNAVYFKGDWRDQFDPAETHDLPFTALDGSTTDVPTMHREGGFRSGRTANATVVELPYGGDAFVMTILVPDAGLSVNAMAASLTGQGWQDAVATLADSRAELYLPKFRLAWGGELNEALKRMGMVRAFDTNGADFTRISSTVGDQLYISFVKQKTYVDVDEVGTEAAAVTGIGIGTVSLPAAIHVDRPFLFALRERLSGTILFLGKIVTVPAP